MEYKVLNKKRDTFYQVVFFAGLILMIWEITIFRKTVISLGFLLLIIFGIGSIASFLDFKNYSQTYDLKGWKLYFFNFTQNILSWGFIACSILVLSNFYLSEGEIVEEKYEIIETSSMTGSKRNRSKRKPLVRIEYKGKMKELVFSNRFYNELEEYNYVNIGVKKGFFNWDKIVTQELEK